MRHLYTLGASAIALTSFFSSTAAYSAENSIYTRQAPSLYDIYNALYTRDAEPYAYADPFADPGFLDEIEDFALELRGKQPKGSPGQSSSNTNNNNNQNKGNGGGSNSNLAKEFGPNLPPPVNVGWYKGNAPKKPSQREDRKNVEQATQKAADNENRKNPPVSPGGTTHLWTDATIKHGFQSDSSKHVDKGGNQGVASPHINAQFKADNGFVSNKHIGKDGNIRQRQKRDAYLRAAGRLLRRAMVEG